MDSAKQEEDDRDKQQGVLELHLPEEWTLDYDIRGSQQFVAEEEAAEHYHSHMEGSESVSNIAMK